MPAVNLRHIEIFHAVMTTGNLTEAARMLHTSQPTVSRELARFEKVLGLTLFSRTRGRLQPTVQGLRLFEEFNRVGVTVLMATHDLGLISSRPYRVLSLSEGHMHGGHIGE